MNTHTDFDIHGIVGVQVQDATTKDILMVGRQLGLVEKQLERPADIIIRFVDKLKTPESMRYLDLGDIAFTDDSFYVLKGKHKSRTKVKIPFQDIGSQCEIVCERGLAAVPHLIDIINTVALGNGFLPLHASAFNYDGVGVVVTGWSKGGKTETLLAFMAEGAEYVGDEWVYISRDGALMAGIPIPIRVWDWHLDDLPNYRKILGRRDRYRLRVLKTFVRITEKISEGKIGKGYLSKLMNRVAPLLKKQMYVNWSPGKVFHNTKFLMKGRPDKLFFVGNHISSDVVVSPMDPSEIAKRIYFSIQEERDDFIAIYQQYRFAFPEQPNELIDQSSQIQQELLNTALSGKESYSVFHPYPAPVSKLFEVISPLCKPITEV